VIHSDRELEIQEKFKIGFSVKQLQPESQSTSNSLDSPSISQDYLNLFESLTKGLLSEEEVNSFHRLKASQYYVVLSEKAESTGKKIEFLKEAIRLHDTNHDAHRMLAHTYLNLGLLKEADEHVEKLFKIDPKSANALFLRAHILHRNGDYKQALDSYIKLFSEYFVISAALPIVEIYVRLGNIEKAYEYALKHYEFEPNSTSSLNSLANILRLLGNYDEALKFVYQSISFGPKNPFPYSTLAEINSVKGNDEEFYKNLEVALIFQLPFDEIFLIENVYLKYCKEEKFIQLVRKYGFDLDSLIEKKSITGNSND
jgi:tetratricopeptide (TPR) repeat protein